MKFNFENFGSKAKDKIKKIAKVGLIAGAGLATSSSAEAQTKAQIDTRNASVEYLNKVAVDFPEKQKDTYEIKKSDKVTFEYRKGLKKQTDNFFHKLDSLGLIPEGMDEYQFAALSPAEHDDYITKYMKKTGAITRADLPPGNYEVIEVRENDIGKKTIHETIIPGAQEFDFNSWFAEQVALGNEGKTMLAPDGNRYLIKIDPNAKISDIAKSTTEKTLKENKDVVIAETFKRVNMADLHNEDKDSRLDK